MITTNPTPVTPSNTERGTSPVVKPSIFATRKARIAAIAVGSAIAAGLLSLSVISARQQREPTEPNKPPSAIAQNVPTPEPTPPYVPPAPPEPKIIVIHDNQLSGAVPKDLPDVLTTPQTPPAVIAPNINYVVFPHDQNDGNFNVALPPPKPAASVVAEQKAPDITRVDFKSTTIEGGKAGPAMHMDYMMRPQLIPCRLLTAVDSTLAGALFCVTTKDVYSPTNIVLMKAGTQIVGVYKNDVKPGQNRLFSFTGTATTPEGIPVPLNSAFADGVGRAGMPGEVDHHLMEKYGAAFLLLGIDSSINIAEAMLSHGSSNNNTTLNIGGSISGNNGGIPNIANEILRSQITAQDTITVPPGATVSVLVDHLISFEDAIKVHAR